jgi:hypothetical protein
MSEWNGNTFDFNQDGEIFALGMRNEVGRKINKLLVTIKGYALMKMEYCGG